MRDFRSELFKLVASSDLQGLKLLYKEVPGFLEESKVLVQSEDNENTALHVAIANNDFEMSKYLLEIGFSPNQKGLADNTPLHWAGIRGNLEMIKLLLENGAEFNNEENYEGLRFADYVIINEEATREFIIPLSKVLEESRYSDKNECGFYVPSYCSDSRSTPTLISDSKSFADGRAGGLDTRGSVAAADSATALAKVEKSLIVSLSKIDPDTQLLPCGRYLPLTLLTHLYYHPFSPETNRPDYISLVALAMFHEKSFSGTEIRTDPNFYSHELLFQFNTLNLDIEDRDGQSLFVFLRDNPSAIELIPDKIRFIGERQMELFEQLKGRFAENPSLIKNFSDDVITKYDDLEDVVEACFQGKDGYPNLGLYVRAEDELRLSDIESKNGRYLKNLIINSDYNNTRSYSLLGRLSGIYLNNHPIKLQGVFKLLELCGQELNRQRLTALDRTLDLKGALDHGLIKIETLIYLRAEYFYQSLQQQLGMMSSLKKGILSSTNDFAKSAYHLLERYNSRSLEDKYVDTIGYDLDGNRKKNLENELTSSDIEKFKVLVIAYSGYIRDWFSFCVTRLDLPIERINAIVNIVGFDIQSYFYNINPNFLNQLFSLGKYNSEVVIWAIQNGAKLKAPNTNIIYLLSLLPLLQKRENIVKAGNFVASLLAQEVDVLEVAKKYIETNIFLSLGREQLAKARAFINSSAYKRITRMFSSASALVDVLRRDVSADQDKMIEALNNFYIISLNRHLDVSMFRALIDYVESNSMSENHGITEKLKKIEGVNFEPRKVVAYLEKNSEEGPEFIANYLEQLNSFLTSKAKFVDIPEVIAAIEDFILCNPRLSEREVLENFAELKRLGECFPSAVAGRSRREQFEASSALSEFFTLDESEQLVAKAKISAEVTEGLELRTGLEHERGGAAAGGGGRRRGR